MPRKTQFKKSKRGTRNMRKSKRMSRHKTRKYRGKGGCSNGTCMSNSSPQWNSKGGDPEAISKDINNYVTDGSFYSSAN
jgi:hypothetical protein